MGLGVLAASLPFPVACSTPTDPDLLARGLRLETAEKHAGGLNNFYEFTTVKDQVWKKAIGYPVDPWKIEVSGAHDALQRV